MPRKKKIVEEVKVKKTSTKKTSSKKATKKVEEVKVVELPKVVSEEEITTYVGELLQTKSDVDLKTFTELVKEHFMNREVDVKIIAKLAGRILHKNKIQKTVQSNEVEVKEESLVKNMLSKEEILIVYNSLTDPQVRQNIVQGLSCFGLYIVTNPNGEAEDVVKNNNVYQLVQKALSEAQSNEDATDDIEEVKKECKDFENGQPSTPKCE